MTLRASQVIASAFGTYRPGEQIDADAAGPVLEAWLAAGLVIDEPEPATATRAGTTETATSGPPEAAMSPRQRRRPRTTRTGA